MVRCKSIQEIRTDGNYKFLKGIFIELFTFLILPLLGAINSQNFPDVLSSEEEQKYLDLWKNKDFEARNTLIEHNLRLVAHIVKKYESTKLDKDDLLSIGTFGLIKAVDTFNFDAANKLSTYAARCIENEILMHIRSNKKRKDTISLYSPIGEDKEGNEISLCDIIEDPSPSISESIIKEEQTNKLYEALKVLNKREYEIITRRYGLNNREVETQQDVADSLEVMFLELKNVLLQKCIYI